MTFRIPNSQDKRFLQLNKGDVFGNTFSTFNADFRTNPGRYRVASRLKVAVKDNDTSITGMGVPIAFGVLDQSSTRKYVVVTGIGTGTSTAGTGRVFVSDDGDFNSDWDNEGSSNTPTIVHLGFSDAVVWRERLYVSTFSLVADSRIYELSNTTWDTNFLNTRGTTDFKTQGGIKNLCPAFNGNLYFTDDDEINYVPPSGNAVQSGAGTINFSGVYRPIWIRSGSSRLWIGLMTYDDNVGSRGFVAEWNAQGTAAQKIYDIGAPCALSCAILNDIPYIVDAYGVLKKFNGSGFSEVARLPVANLNIEMPGIYDDINNSRWIHHRGMDVSDGRILINVNNFVSTGVYVEDMPSGVWEYDPATGSLHHRNSPCADDNDNGQQLVSTAGAIMATRRTEGNYLAGFGYYTDDATTERKGVFYDDVVTDTNKRGIITTPFLTAEGVDESYQKLIYRHAPIPSGDKIIGKFRLKKSTTLPFIAGITWTSSTTFTSTDANFANISGGEECEFVMGKHSGTTAHVSSISENGGTYTVTIDDAVGSASGSGKVKMTNFKKIAEFSTQNDTENSPTIDFGSASTKVQLKTECRFTGEMELEDITLITAKHK